MLSPSYVGIAVARDKVDEAMSKLVVYWLILTCVSSAVFGSADLHDATGEKASPTVVARHGIIELDTMCGPNCLYQIARAYGKETSPDKIARLAETNAYQGTTVEGMLDACEALSLPAVAVRTNLKVLSKDRRVAVLLLDVGELRHYVILDEVGQRTVRLLDATVFHNVSVDDFLSMWTGVAVLIGKTPPRKHTGAILLSSGAAAILLGLYLRKRQSARRRCKWR